MSALVYKVFRMRVTAQYHQWMSELAARERLTMSQLADHALLHYAEIRGFKPPPPR